jgi:hypothetical protein
MKARKETKDFIEKYLSKGTVGKGDGLYRMMKESKGTNKLLVACRIRRMNYSDFLETRYWKLVSLQVKSDAHWRCSSCGGHSGLVAHHLGYEHHGYEMYHIRDIQCLCRACHERLHGIRA